MKFFHNLIYKVLEFQFIFFLCNFTGNIKIQKECENDSFYTKKH